jgi:hypothetical protein
MEPTSAEVVYTIPTTVIDIEQRFARLHVSGHGPDAIFKNLPVGWFIHLAGSGEALYLGQEKPDFKTGDPVIIQIRRPNAKPRPASEQ